MLMFRTESFRLKGPCLTSKKGVGAWPEEGPAVLLPPRLPPSPPPPTRSRLGPSSVAFSCRCSFDCLWPIVGAERCRAGAEGAGSGAVGGGLQKASGCWLK